MIAVVLAFIVLIGGITASVKLRKGFIAALTGIAVLALVLIGSIRTVPAGHTGVVTTFGRVENYTLDSGAHFVAPWTLAEETEKEVRFREEKKIGEKDTDHPFCPFSFGDSLVSAYLLSPACWMTFMRTDSFVVGTVDCG